MSQADENGIERHRSRLFGVAYRLLGSASEAEDMVQEAFLRWHQAARRDVQNPVAFLTTIVTRLCLDFLKSARARRETYFGPWLPEPLLTEDGNLAERLESISTAFLIALERLTPLERAAYLLHEVFGYSHGEVAVILKRETAACRQLHARARKALVQARPRFEADPAEHRHLVESFVAACQAGDLEALVALLAPDVVARSDGGGQAGAAGRTLLGPREVGRLYFGLARNAPASVKFALHSVNGYPAIVVSDAGVLLSVIQVTVWQGRIAAIDTMLNTDKLRHVATALRLERRH